LDVFGSTFRFAGAAWLASAAFLLVFAAPRSSAAQTEATDLQVASLEDLMNMRVTSASRKEQRSGDVPAAVFVISADQIRQSGMTQIPELLRLVPGVSVAQIDANKWAVTIRGFNGRWSDKLLVLVDGRTVYNRLFSGVYWEGLSVPLATIDRIEVVRGPGGSIWGTNAINGVINILTKSASDTRGAAVQVSGGANGAASGDVQYGGRLGAADYRVTFGTARGGRHVFAASDGDASDSWRHAATGFRVDWKNGADQVSVHGDLSGANFGSRFRNTEGPIVPPQGWPPLDERARFVAGNVLGRWTRTAANGRSLQLQAFFDIWDRREPTRDQHRARTFDADAKFQTRIGARHELVAGTGVRRTAQRTLGSHLVTMTPEEQAFTIVNAFAQDEIQVADDRIRITAGTKVEYDSAFDWSVQPTARVIVFPAGRQRLWGAVSRAVRTPARIDRDIHANISSSLDATGTPVLVTYDGNPEYRPEQAYSTEAGYRLEHQRLSFDAAVFHNHHHGLRATTQLPPVFEVTPAPPHVRLPLLTVNGLDTDTRGVEFAARWEGSASWHVDATYSFLTMTARFAPGLVLETNEFDGSSPRHQARVQSTWSVTRQLSAGLSVQRVGALRLLQVPAYTRVDAQLEYRIRPAWSLVFTGQNLTDRAHHEFGLGDNTSLPSQVPRHALLRLRGEF
jgi:iron complex outermembrane receptor protein